MRKNQRVKAKPEFAYIFEIAVFSKVATPAKCC